MASLNAYQRGLSLVELLVSMLISGIILGGVVSVVQSSRNTSANEVEVSFIQENARYVMEILARDIRSAGNFDCARPERATVSIIINGQINGLLHDPAAVADDRLYPIESVIGYDNGSVFPGVLSVADNTSDAIILRYTDPNRAVAAGAHDRTALTFTFPTDHSFQQGEKLVAIGPTCLDIGIFENTSNSDNEVGYNSGGGVPGNCNSPLISDDFLIHCGTSSSSLRNFDNGSMIMPYVSNAYYIDDSAVIPGLPALKRRVLSNAGAGFRTEELAQGVESMQLLYGIDTEIDDDRADGYGDVNVFLEADDVADWNQVIAVRMNLIFRSQQAVFDANRPVTINNVDYNDRFLRQLGSSTIKLRNRAP